MRPYDDHESTYWTWIMYGFCAGLLIVVGVFAVWGWHQNKDIIARTDQYHSDVIKYHEYIADKLVTMHEHQRDILDKVHASESTIINEMLTCNDCNASDLICPCFGSHVLDDATVCDYTTSQTGFTWTGNYDWSISVGEYVGAASYTTTSGFTCRNPGDILYTPVTNPAAGEDCMQKLTRACPRPTCDGNADDINCACDVSLELEGTGSGCYLASLTGLGDNAWVTRYFSFDTPKACASISSDCYGFGSPQDIYSCSVTTYDDVDETINDVNAEPTCEQTKCIGDKIWDHCTALRN